MALEPNEPWLLRLLAVVRTRPGMWVPGPETAANLQTYLIAYRQARADLGMPEYGRGEEDLLERFEKWVGEHLKSSKTMGWASYVQEADSSPKNVHTFFRLFEEFLAEIGMSLPLPEEAAWPADDSSFNRH